jgi:ankyrin repeat protein
MLKMMKNTMASSQAFTIATIRPGALRHGVGRGAKRLSLALAGGLMCAAWVSNVAYASSADTMIKAVKFDDVSEVKKQLANGGDPNLTDQNGMPILVIAAREKSDKVAAVLIADSKTDLEKLDPAGENAMMLAALNGDLDIVKRLISKNAEVNKKGWAPLHYAATNGHDDVAQLLVDHSAYIDAGSPNGTTPLMMAARGNHLATVKVLLNAGADPALKNQLGLTALDFAKQYHAKDVTEALSARAQSLPSTPGAEPASTQNSAK